MASQARLPQVKLWLDGAPRSLLYRAQAIMQVPFHPAMDWIGEAIGCSAALA